MPESYFHLIGGDARGRRHEPGDPVDSALPPRKVNEWVKAGIVEQRADKPIKRTKKVSKRADEQCSSN